MNTVDVDEEALEILMMIGLYDHLLGQWHLDLSRAIEAVACSGHVPKAQQNRPNQRKNMRVFLAMTNHLMMMNRNHLILRDQKDQINRMYLTLWVKVHRKHSGEVVTPTMSIRKEDGEHWILLRPVRERRYVVTGLWA
jgi:hypothetical protein